MSNGFLNMKLIQFQLFLLKGKLVNEPKSEKFHCLQMNSNSMKATLPRKTKPNNGTKKIILLAMPAQHRTPFGQEAGG